MKKNKTQIIRNELVKAWTEKAENDFGFAKTSFEDMGIEKIKEKLN